jgi:hypothetical protein
MNCATHNEVAAVAFCRTCGKPLCNQCTRDVRGVIYCEACLASRMEGAAPAGAYPTPQNPYQTVLDPSQGLRLPPPQAAGPNPTVAGILSGFFPFGVGAVYCSQYAKGLAHLVIMVLLIIGVSSNGPWFMHMFFGLGIGFFYFYQIIDSVRTAKALQVGEPIPDPFGLVSMFGGTSSAGAPSASGAGGTLGHGAPAKIPVAAAVLIGLGVLFLINTAFNFNWGNYWPLILIVLGVYLFAKHWGLLGNYHPVCVCERCRTRKLMGPALLVTLGVLFLLNSVSEVSLGRTWPAILLVVGVVKLMQSNSSYTGHVGPLPPGSSFPPAPPPPPPPPSFTNPPPAPPPSHSPSDAPGTDPSSGEVKEVKNV